MKKIFAVCLILAVTGCVRYDIEEILTSRDEVSLTWKGTEQFVYDPATCQMSFNVAGNEFRAQKDNLSGWFVLKCSELPVNEGDEIEADISWTGISDNRTMKNLEFKVRKTSEDGMIWLWSKSSKIGVTIRRLQ